MQLCGIVAVACGILNLFADLCFIDFYLAQMTFVGFGTFDGESRPGNLFDFNADWPLKLAQASGWMYPVWAMATVYQLYVGLSGGRTDSRRGMLPCALFAYGLCVVGGNLHSGFAFACILPQVFHSSPQLSGDESAMFHFAQRKLMDTYVFGYTPGPMAVMGASVWIAYLVVKQETKFPRWFALCTPLVTAGWVAAVGSGKTTKTVYYY